MTENEHFTGIVTSTKIQDRDWLAIGVAAAAGALAACVLLAAVAAYFTLQAIAAHSVATEKLSITLKQVHYLNEKKIAKEEGREPRLQPSESPLPESLR